MRSGIKYGARLFTELPSNRGRGKRYKLKHGELWLNVRNNFLTEALK